MTTTANSEVSKSAKALSCHNWRRPSKPVHGDENGQRLPKMARSRVDSASTGSTLGGSDETQVGMINYCQQENRRSSAGILGYTVISTGNPISESAKSDLPAIMDSSRTVGKQRLRPGSNVFAIDIVLRNETQEVPCESNQWDDIPRAVIEEIRNSNRFKLVDDVKRGPSTGTFAQKTWPKIEASTSICKENDREHQGAADPTAEALCTNEKRLGVVDNATEAILSDQAVLSVNGIRAREARETTPTKDRKAEFSEIINKLHRAAKDHHTRQQAVSHGPERKVSAPQSSRKAIHLKEQSHDSFDSGINMDCNNSETSRLRKSQSSTSLNPATAEFVAYSARLIDPSIIEQSCNGIVERGTDFAGSGQVAGQHLANERAFEAMNNCPRTSLDCLRDVVQETLQKFGIPGPALQPWQLPYSAIPPPPYGGCGGLGQPVMSPMHMPPNFGIPPLGAGPPPLHDAGISASCELPPQQIPQPPFHLSGTPSGPAPFFNGLPPLPFTPFMPPTFSQGAGLGLGSQPSMLPSLPPSMPPWNVARGQPSNPSIPPRKPRVPDAMSQQEYEAHIEWRKANEPGYALRCKERQSRRNLRNDKKATCSLDYGNKTNNSVTRDIY